MENIFNTLLKKKILEKKIYNGVILNGIVKDITTKYVIVDIGLKSEGFIEKSEFYDKNKNLEIKINDSTEVLLESIETRSNIILLSRDKVKKIQNWNKLEKAYFQNEIIKGKIINKIKGGFIVELDTIKSFLPGSLLNKKQQKDYEKLEGKIFDFKILKLNKKLNSIIVSRKDLLFEENTDIDKNIIFNNIHKNQQITGIIKNIADYGVFIDLGGIDGLLHITDIFWSGLKHPNTIFTIGQLINVKIIKFDQKKNRIFLGFKQLTEDPWIDITKKYPKNSKIIGTVTNILDYGCFVELDNGIEGLIHISEMVWSNKNINPTTIVKQKQKINAIVLSVDEKKRQIFLGLKQCKENPWKKFNQLHKVGEIITGIIKSLTPFGIFVELNEDIEGFINLNDLTWSSSEQSEELKNYKNGEKITTIILSIEVKKERITLGLKQLTCNPLLEFIKKYKNQQIIGTVKQTNQKNTILSIEKNIEGILDSTELTKQETHIGQKITVYISSKEHNFRYVYLTKKNI